MAPPRALMGWSQNYTECQKCGRTQFRHWAKGLCESCYKSTSLKRRKELRKKALGVIDEKEGA